MEIIPAIDLLGGRCVRLFQGDFTRVTDYGDDPLELAMRYRSAGARRLHVVDLDGARTGAAANLELITKLAAVPELAVQAGGGIRSSAAVDRLLAAGVGRIVVGSMAVTEPRIALDWLGASGPERFVLAFDVRLDPSGSEPVVMTHGWREQGGKGLWQLMEQFLAAGARYFLCTDVGRDGTLAGPNNALYAECTRRFPEARILASGGLAGAADLPALAATGVAGVIAGRALLDGTLTFEEIKRFSRAE